MTFRGLKVLGLCAIALGVMAIGAAAAQAEGSWSVNNTTVTSPLLPQVQTVAPGIEGEDGILLTTVGLSPVEILCKKLTLKDALLHEGGKSTAEALLFSECSVKINGEAAPKCNPTTTGSEAGHITTNPIKDLLVLHEGGVVLDEFAPAAGEVFVTFTFGPECGIGNEFKVTGKFFGKDCEGKLSVEQLQHLISEGPLSTLKFGTHAATLDGSSNLMLIGEHNDMNWSGHAP